MFAVGGVGKSVAYSSSDVLQANTSYSDVRHPTAEWGESLTCLGGVSVVLREQVSHCTRVGGGVCLAYTPLLVTVTVSTLTYLLLHYPPPLHAYPSNTSPIQTECSSPGEVCSPSPLLHMSICDGRRGDTIRPWTWTFLSPLR